MLYFTADWHLWHKNIIKYCNRPFKHVDEMNKTIIRNYNKRIKEEDEVWFLGDLTMGNDQYKLQNIIDNLKGTKHLVLGNHDKLRPWQYLEVGFSSVHTNTSIQIGDGSRNGDREYFLIHDPALIQVPNSLAICGHIHNHWVKMKSKKLNTVMVNCGVDCWEFSPVSVEEIIKII